MADLHEIACDKFTILAYDCRVRKKKCRRTLKQVLKRCDNRSRN